MKYQSNTFLLGEEPQWQEVDKGVKRQILGYDDHIMTVKMNFEKDAVGATHSHPHSQTSYIVSGRFAFTVGEQTMIVQQGDGLYIEPNISHGLVCIDEGIVIDNFSPVREDFLL